MEKGGRREKTKAERTPKGCNMNRIKIPLEYAPELRIS